MWLAILGFQKMALNVCHEGKVSIPVESDKTTSINVSTRVLSKK